MSAWSGATVQSWSPETDERCAASSAPASSSNDSPCSAQTVCSGRLPPQQKSMPNRWNTRMLDGCCVAISATVTVSVTLMALRLQTVCRGGDPGEGGGELAGVDAVGGGHFRNGLE